MTALYDPHDETDADSGAPRNRILASAGLTVGGLSALGSWRTFERGEAIHLGNGDDHLIVFPESMVATVVAILRDGTSVEVGSVGREGMVGFMSSRSDGPALSIQIERAGGAFVTTRSTLETLLQTSPALQQSVLLNMETQLILSAQLGACHRLHALPQRLARWILLNGDRVEAEAFDVTQERLGEILGARRPAVNIALHHLTDEHLVKNHRGNLVIEDRPGLMLEACECYQDLADALHRARLSSLN